MVKKSKHTVHEYKNHSTCWCGHPNPNYKQLVALTQVPEDYAAGQQSTSRAAFHSTNRQTMRGDVLRFFKQQGAHGATADEVVVHFDSTMTLTTSYAPRVTELFREGLLIQTQRRRKTTKGRGAIVYQYK